MTTGRPASLCSASDGGSAAERKFDRPTLHHQRSTTVRMLEPTSLPSASGESRDELRDARGSTFLVRERPERSRSCGTSRFLTRIGHAVEAIHDLRGVQIITICIFDWLDFVSKLISQTSISLRFDLKHRKKGLNSLESFLTLRCRPRC